MPLNEDQFGDDIMANVVSNIEAARRHRSGEPPAQPRQPSLWSELRQAQPAARGQTHISGDEIEHARSVIAPHDTEERRAAYRAGNYPRAEHTQDVNRRYRWDLYWHGEHRFEGNDVMDAHIDTALRKIVPPL